MSIQIEDLSDKDIATLQRIDDEGGVETVAKQGNTSAEDFDNDELGKLWDEASIVINTVNPDLEYIADIADDEDEASKFSQADRELLEKYFSRNAEIEESPVYYHSNIHFEDKELARRFDSARDFNFELDYASVDELDELIDASYVEDEEPEEE